MCVRSYANHFSPGSKNVLWHVHNMHSEDYRSSCLPYTPGIVFIFVLVYVRCGLDVCVMSVHVLCIFELVNNGISNKGHHRNHLRTKNTFQYVKKHTFLQY